MNAGNYPRWWEVYATVRKMLKSNQCLQGLRVLEMELETYLIKIGQAHDARQGDTAGSVSLSPDIQSWVRNALSSQRWEAGALGQKGGQSQLSTGMLSNSNFTPLQREQAKAAMSRILARRNTQDGGINAIMQANAHRTTEKGGLSACVLCGGLKITTYAHSRGWVACRECFNDPANDVYKKKTLAANQTARDQKMKQRAAVNNAGVTESKQNDNTAEGNSVESDAFNHDALRSSNVQKSNHNCDDEFMDEALFVAQLMHFTNGEVKMMHGRDVTIAVAGFPPLDVSKSDKMNVSGDDEQKSTDEDADPAERFVLELLPNCKRRMYCHEESDKNVTVNMIQFEFEDESANDSDDGGDSDDWIDQGPLNGESTAPTAWISTRNDMATRIQKWWRVRHCTRKQVSICVRVQVSYGMRTNFTQMRHAGDVETRTMLLHSDFFDNNVNEHQRRFSAWYNGIGASPWQRQYTNDVRAVTVWWQPTFKVQATDAVDVAMWDEKLARGSVQLLWQKPWVEGALRECETDRWHNQNYPISEQHADIVGHVEGHDGPVYFPRSIDDTKQFIFNGYKVLDANTYKCRHAEQLPEGYVLAGQYSEQGCDRIYQWTHLPVLTDDELSDNETYDASISNDDNYDTDSDTNSTDSDDRLMGQREYFRHLHNQRDDAEKSKIVLRGEIYVITSMEIETGGQVKQVARQATIQASIDSERSEWIHMPETKKGCKTANQVAAAIFTHVTTGNRLKVDELGGDCIAQISTATLSGMMKAMKDGESSNFVRIVTRRLEKCMESVNPMLTKVTVNDIIRHLNNSLHELVKLPVGFEAVSSQSSVSPPCVVDSGSDLCVACPQFLVNIRQRSKPIMVSGFQGEQADVMLDKIGDFILQWTDGHTKRKFEMHIHDVLVCDGSVPILGVGVLATYGIHFSNSDGAVLQFPNGSFSNLIQFKVAGMYHLQESFTEKQPSQAAKYSAITERGVSQSSGNDNAANQPL